MKCKFNGCNRKSDRFLFELDVKKHFLGIQWESSRTHPRCQPHLIESFRTAFLASEPPMLVCEPDPSFHKAYFQYTYQTLKDFERGYAPEKQLNQLIIDRISGWLKSISKHCRACGTKTTSVAYFKHSEIPYQQVSGYLGGKFKFAMFHEVNVQPEILCKDCTFTRLLPSLNANTNLFKEGIALPKTEPGVYFSIEI